MLVFSESASATRTLRAPPEASLCTLDVSILAVANTDKVFRPPWHSSLSRGGSRGGARLKAANTTNPFFFLFFYVPGVWCVARRLK